MTDDHHTGLEARMSELEAKCEQYRRLYMETLERCALLERGIVAGKKAERFTSEDSQLTLQVLGQVLAPEPPGAAPAEALHAPEPEREPARRGPARRRALPPELPRVVIEVLPPEVQREGLDAFERIGEEVSEVVEHRSASVVVVRIVRPKFVRRRHADAQDEVGEDDVLVVLIAEPPERPIERGIAGPTCRCNGSRASSPATASSSRARRSAAGTSSSPTSPVTLLSVPRGVRGARFW